MLPTYLSLTDHRVYDTQLYSIRSVSHNKEPCHKDVPGQVPSASADCRMCTLHQRSTCTEVAYDRLCEFCSLHCLPSSRLGRSCAQ